MPSRLREMAMPAANSSPLGVAPHVAMARFQIAVVSRSPTGTRYPSTARIAAGESLVLISALIPNRRGQPVLNDWFAVRVGLNGKVLGDLSFDELIKSTGWTQGVSQCGQSI